MVYIEQQAEYMDMTHTEKFVSQYVRHVTTIFSGLDCDVLSLGHTRHMGFLQMYFS